MISELLLGIREKFKNLYGEDPDIIASAPGRIDLLNTHQDYKGLPVVGAAINLRCYAASSLSSNDYVHAFSDNVPEGESECVFHVNEAVSADIRGKGFCNYVKAIYKVLYNEIGLSKGLNIYIKSHVPIGAGLGSSAALEVALIKAITSLFNISLSTKNIAELAYRAEHDVMGIPCGRLDQYSSAYGGMLLISTKPPYRVEEIPFNEGIFVILDSGIRHKTAEIHPVRQKEIDKALSVLLSMNDLPNNLRVKLGRHYWEPAWELLLENELILYINRLDDISRKRILFTLKMHRSTMAALSILKGNVLSIDEVMKSLGISKADASRLIPKRSKSISKKLLILGLIMNYQHELLRDLYDVSLPSIEKIRNAILDAGALGCKLSGAGLGGSVVALVSNYEDAWIVLREGLKAGAINGWITQLDQGVRREF